MTANGMVRPCSCPASCVDGPNNIARLSELLRGNAAPGEHRSRPRAVPLEKERPKPPQVTQRGRRRDNAYAACGRYPPCTWRANKKGGQSRPLPFNQSPQIEPKALTRHW